MNKKSKLLKNVISGFGGQLVAIILGLIVPRFFIMSYGSDVNGLLSTINQIFTYMALLEAGIGQAARNLLYKPFQGNNKESISEIASIAKSYFRRFTFIYGIGVIAIAFILPFVLKTNVDLITIVLVVLFEGMSGVISFYFIETPSIIIGVDGKNYVNNGINLVNKIVGYAVKIVMAAFGLNIVLLQFVFFLITITKVIFYQIYFYRHYSWIKFKKIGRGVKLKDRNAYILTEIASTVFSSTDMIVISTFISTQLASVYSIYNMIFTNVQIIQNSVYFSVVYLLGNAYQESIQEYEKVHDSFSSIFLCSLTILMSLGYILTIPFVKLYTGGISDINYIYPSLPFFISFYYLLAWCKAVPGNLTGLAGYAKQTSHISLIEAISNVVLSIVFVHKFGIIGVTFATVISLPLKVAWCIYIADKKVMKRSYWKTIKTIGINFLFYFGVVFISCLFELQINSYFQLFIFATILCLLFSIVCIGLNYVANRNCWKVLLKKVINR